MLVVLVIGARPHKQDQHLAVENIISKASSSYGVTYNTLQLDLTGTPPPDFGKSILHFPHRSVYLNCGSGHRSRIIQRKSILRLDGRELVLEHGNNIVMPERFCGLFQCPCILSLNGQTLFAYAGANKRFTALYLSFIVTVQECVSRTVRNDNNHELN